MPALQLLQRQQLALQVQRVRAAVQQQLAAAAAAALTAALAAVVATEQQAQQRQRVQAAAELPQLRQALALLPRRLQQAQL